MKSYGLQSGYGCKQKEVSFLPVNRMVRGSPYTQILCLARPVYWEKQL